MAVASSFLKELVLFLGLQCLTLLPVNTKIGKWSEISATSLPDRKYSSLLPCYLVPSSRGRLLVISMTISLQASRSLVSPHSSLSVQFVMPLMSSSHRARGLPLVLAPPPIPKIIDFSKLFSLPISTYINIIN